MAQSKIQTSLGLKVLQRTAISNNLQRATPGPFLDRHRNVLDRTLTPWQVYLMTFSMVVGVGFFQNTTYAINVAGTGGGTFAFLIVGIVALCVVTSISEMLSIFPITNPMAEFVRAFLDEDLAGLIGAGHWLIYAALFNAFIVSALNLLCLSAGSEASVRFGVTCAWLVALLAINLMPVRVYGHIEAIFGVIKLGFIIAIIGVIAYTCAQSDISGALPEPTFGSDGIRTSGDTQAILSAMSLAIFPYVGIEAVATMSAESMNESKVVPAMSTISPIACVVSVLLCALSGLAVGRQNPRLTSYTNQGMGGLVPPPRHGSSDFDRVSALITAMEIYDMRPKIINGLLVFCAISSASTALYVSSRSLFGAAKSHQFRIAATKLAMDGFGRVTSRNRVPTAAVAMSFASLVWLTFMNMVSIFDFWEITQLATNVATVSCLMLWASQCIAYLRFYHFRSRFADRLKSANITLAQPKKHSSLASLQPFTAWVGLIGCLFLLFVCNTALFWSFGTDTSDYGLTVTGVWLAPTIGISCYFVLKGMRVSGQHGHKKPFYVHFDQWHAFKTTILKLQSQIHPTDYPVEAESSQPPEQHNKLRGQTMHVRSSESTPTVSTEGSTQSSPPCPQPTTRAKGLNISEPVISQGFDALLFADYPSACKQLSSPAQSVMPHPCLQSDSIAIGRLAAIHETPF